MKVLSLSNECNEIQQEIISECAGLFGITILTYGYGKRGGWYICLLTLEVCDTAQKPLHKIGVKHTTWNFQPMLQLDIIRTPRP